MERKSFPIDSLYVHAVIGNFEKVEAVLEEFSKNPELYRKLSYSPEHFDEIMNVLTPMVIAPDRSGIAALLHEWEEVSVKNLKLEKYWEKTPFPIELEK